MKTGASLSTTTKAVIASATILTIGFGVPALASNSLENLAIDTWDAIAKPKQDKRYTHDYCKTDGAYCGAIAYANAGGYVVKSVDVHAKDSQPSDRQINPYCAAVEKKFTSNLSINQYDTFIVPANCLYKLKINIQSGPKKDRDIYLTPGCVAQTWTDGTTTSNEWHKDISWADGAKPSGAGSTPTDANGNKCRVS